MARWGTRLSKALLGLSFSIWSRRFLPESDAQIEKTVNGIVSVVVFLIDIVDVVFDCIFAKRVVEDAEGGSLEWGIALVVGTIVSHLVDVKSLFLDMSLAENCVTELAVFYIEDVTMIMLIGNVNDAYNPQDNLDVATVWFSVISAIVTILQLAVQVWQTKNAMSSKGLTRKICLLVIAVFPSLVFLGLLGELLLDGALTLDEGVFKWTSIVLYVLGISFGLVISFRVLIQPIAVNKEPSEEDECTSSGDKAECHTDYVLA